MEWGVARKLRDTTFSLIAFRYRVLKEVKKSPHSVSTGGYGECRRELPGTGRGFAGWLKSLHRHNGS